MNQLTSENFALMAARWPSDLLPLPEAGEGRWKVGCDGVEAIYTTRDRKIEFICYVGHTLAWVTSSLGHPACYPINEPDYEAPAAAVLMDLDGTTIKSEPFWIWIIERTVADLLGDDGFKLAPKDEPFVSGHSVSEHLNYCLDKYAQGHTLEDARESYFRITRRELGEIAAGRGNTQAFKPTPGLKEFLTEVKSHGIKIGLVSSGLYEKAWPSIVSVFRQLGLGDPMEFYDGIITAGSAVRRGQCGTLGELSPKPHPWLYAEMASVGLGIHGDERRRVVGIEDSGAGIVSVRLAGFAAIGLMSGNIPMSGATPLLFAGVNSLVEAIPLVLGR